MRCRICRTARNLKFTPQQLRLQTKSKNTKNKLRLPLSAIPQTTGNICVECDERLQNFHKFDDDDDDVVDVDSDGFRENNKLQIGEPLIVEDDKRLYDLFYNNTALQCNDKSALLCQTGSDGDPEVIEVLTSRETTPDTMASLNSNNILNNIGVPANPTIIAVIDLEEEEEEEEEDETSRDNRKEFSQFDKSVKSEGNETRLLGCLNLVSSDSESEINFEPCTLENDNSFNKSSSHERLSASKLNERRVNGVIECTNNNNNINCKNTSVNIQHNLPVCVVCGINFIDKQSLLIHMSNHEDFKCPVCNACFHMPLDLVNHMRKKHRSYDGNDLCEGARCSQDSAMTIRLRYKQRFTFYECQLCGLIDSQFKAHKTHIMQKHADESKSLRDPMMKTQLKCPSCHQICGTHHVDVCRHLLGKHEDMESSIYLKEITDLKILKLNPKSLENVQHKARILTLGSNEQIFYECLLCKLPFTTYKTFSKHSNGHNIDEWKNYRAQTSKAILTSPVKPKRTLKRKIETSNSSKSNAMMQSKVISKKDEQPPLKKPKLEYQNKNKKSALQKDTKLRTEKLPLPAQKTQNNIKTEFLTPPEMTKRQKKVKHKLGNKSQNNKKGQLKAITKVKVKPPLRHFPTQKYHCKHCHLPFKGYRKLQLHLLSSHRADEFFGCENCPKVFISKVSLELHRTQNICRRRRKNTNKSIQNIDSENLDENSNKEERKTCKYRLNSINEELTDSKTYKKEEEKSLENFEPIWLKELLQLSRDKSLKNNELKNETAIDVSYDSNSQIISKVQNFQPTMQTLCRFCGCLKSSEEELALHEKNHIALKDMPWIHYNHAN